MDVSILHLRNAFGVRSEACLECCFVTSRDAPWIVASQNPSSTKILVLKYGKNNYTTVKLAYNESAIFIDKIGKLM